MKTRLTLAILAIAVVLLRVASPASAATGPTGTAEPRDSEFLSARTRLITESQNRALTVNEQFELSVSLFGCGAFSEALLVGRMGLGRTQDTRERGLFHMMIAQCHGALGDYRSAGEAALAGQRLQPLSKELAALRFAYFTKVEDKAQAQAAADTLAQLIPGAGQDEQPIATIQGVICLVKLVARAIQAGMAIYEVGKRAWPEVEPHVKEIAHTVLVIWNETRSQTPAAK
jgi:hypothetical protein